MLEPWGRRRWHMAVSLRTTSSRGSCLAIDCSVVGIQMRPEMEAYLAWSILWAAREAHSE